MSVPAPIRVVIYRRLMLRIAERLATWEGAQVLVTGDSVGQVASQTLDNLVAVGSAATLPVFRPLVGMDKEEVVADAHRIGTYATSILPDEDCCQLFTPRNPLTRATSEEVDAAEALLPLAELIELAVSGAIVEDFRWPMVQIDGSAWRWHRRHYHGGTTAFAEGSSEFAEAFRKDERHDGTKDTIQMAFSSLEELVSAVSTVATIDGDSIKVTGQPGPT